MRMFIFTRRSKRFRKWGVTGLSKICRRKDENREERRVKNEKV
jgi:hypothetical protein